ncbi:MAG: hypothetical protein RLY93_10295 [Sumerlaeia bacterium]
MKAIRYAAGTLILGALALGSGCAAKQKNQPEPRQTEVTIREVEQDERRETTDQREPYVYDAPVESEPAYPEEEPYNSPGEEVRYRENNEPPRARRGGDGPVIYYGDEPIYPAAGQPVREME